MLCQCSFIAVGEYHTNAHEVWKNLLFVKVTLTEFASYLGKQYGYQSSCFYT